LPDALDVDYFSLAVSDSFPIVGASAKTGEGVGRAIAMLLRKALRVIPAV